MTNLINNINNRHITILPNNRVSIALLGIGEDAYNDFYYISSIRDILNVWKEEPAAIGHHFISYHINSIKPPLKDLLSNPNFVRGWYADNLNEGMNDMWDYHHPIFLIRAQAFNTLSRLGIRSNILELTDSERMLRNTHVTTTHDTHDVNNNWPVS